MDTMMALRAHVRGGPGRLVYEQAPVPTAGPGDALIAVRAAAITFAELTWEPEWTARDGTDRTPIAPSHEMSGIVAGLGAGVAGLAVGDEVIGLIDFNRDGAAAEYVAMPGAHLAAKPQSLSHAAAATLPLAALTAWQALTDHTGLQPGEQVLVQGGAGGVGGRSSQVPGGFDVIIDTVGGAVLDDSYRLLREGGRLVTLGAPPDQELAGRYTIRAMFFVVEPDAKGLAGSRNWPIRGDFGQCSVRLSRCPNDGKHSKAAEARGVLARPSSSFADLPSGTSSRSASQAGHPDS